MKRALLILIASVLVFSLILAALYLSPRHPLSPLSTQPVTIKDSHRQFLVYGFLPYWNVSSIEDLDLSHLTHLAYFAIEPTKEGDIKKLSAPGQSEPGWHTLNKPSTQAALNQIRQQNIKTHLAVKLLDKEIIETLLDNNLSQKNLIDNILTLSEEKNFQGINIDFEPEEPVNAATAAQFTQFISHIRQTIESSGSQLELVIDIYPSAAGKKNIWQLGDLAPLIDHFIVMAYDYHPINATHSGPVAPLYAENQKSIIKNLKSLSEQIPLSKIVLGIPTYGYLWQTTSSQLDSPTYPKSGEFLSLNSISKLMSDPAYQLNWDAGYASSWLVNNQEDRTRQIHFDSVPATNLKLDLVKQTQMAGVALWAIGYERGSFNLNQLIKSHNQ